MTRRTVLTLGIIGLLGALAYLVFIGGPPVSWHQRLTVIVDTPDGEVSGASVTEVSVRDDNGLLQMQQTSGVKTSVRGEAVVVEVLPGRYLFALLDGANAWATHAFDLVDQPDAKDRTNSAAMAKLRSLPLDTPNNLPTNAYPLLVTFIDITKPETVQKVDPANLAASFGPGMRLKSVTLEITRESLTEGEVEKKLGWFFDPKYWKNPGWANLPVFVQEVILGLKSPINNSP